MDLDRKQALVAASVFIFAIAIGFSIGEQRNTNQEPELYDSSFNLTLSSENAIQEVNFDNRSVNLLFEDSQEFSAYIDLDRDGSAEKKLNTTSDGSKSVTTELVTLDGQSYRFFFEYIDDPERTEGDFITLYRVKRLQ